MLLGNFLRKPRTQKAISVEYVSDWRYPTTVKVFSKGISFVVVAGGVSAHDAFLKMLGSFTIYELFIQWTNNSICVYMASCERSIGFFDDLWVWYSMN